MKFVYPTRKVIVFSQWSRKSYAVFASLGKLLKIGCVKVDYCDKAIRKTNDFSGLGTNVFSFKGILANILEGHLPATDMTETLILQLGLLSNRFVLTSSSTQNNGDFDPCDNSNPLSRNLFKINHGFFIFCIWEN
jgi:hypothetical protein